MAFPHPVPQLIPWEIRPPTRMVNSGTKSIAPGNGDTYVGTNSRTDRIQIIITNLDPSNVLKWTDVIGGQLVRAGGTIFPQRSVTLLTSADIAIWNPSGNPGNISYEVCELYPDVSGVHRTEQSKAIAAAANPSNGPQGGGSGGSGGGQSGSGGGGGRGGTYVP